MSNWSFSWHGFTTVVGLELRQRVRSRRWIAAIIAWFLAIGSVTGLCIWAVYETYKDSTYEIQGMSKWNPWAESGPMVFSLIVFFVLGLGLVITPSFTATAINGDRMAGTLATLQATKLSALEIVAGKLIAAWLVAALFVVVAAPFITLSVVIGNISIWQVLVCLVTVFIEFAVVCAIGLGWSAIVSRSAGSASLTYLSVVALTCLSVILFGLLTVFVTENGTERVWGDPQWEVQVDESTTTPQTAPPVVVDESEFTETHYDIGPPNEEIIVPGSLKCSWYEYSERKPHTERIWWVLVANPFVIVSDAAPLPPEAKQDLEEYSGLTRDFLSLIRVVVRSLARGPVFETDNCITAYKYNSAYTVKYESDGTPVVTLNSDGSKVDYVSPLKPVPPLNVATPIWPWGLLSNVVIGGFFLWIAVRRLSIPYRKLPKGTRVA